ncbi:MAG: hypothetical protein LBQ66_03815 [Planctomycetaceae bacterium]|nr:hypothetical protein [Planctomycetaceae bacterium]
MCRFFDLVTLRKVCGAPREDKFYPLRTIGQINKQCCKPQCCKPAILPTDKMNTGVTGTQKKLKENDKNAINCNNESKRRRWQNDYGC